MPRLDLAKTVDTPAVEFNPDAGIFRIEGESYPENAMEFYRPVIECLNEFVNQSEKGLEVNLKMLYFNSSSSKCLLDIFDILEEYAGADAGFGSHDDEGGFTGVDEDAGFEGEEAPSEAKPRI